MEIRVLTCPGCGETFRGQWNEPAICYFCHTRMDDERKISWRDTFDVWPYLGITIVPLPWSWRWRWHWENYDDGRQLTIDFGPIRIYYGDNPGLFPLERV